MTIKFLVLFLFFQIFAFCVNFSLPAAKCARDVDCLPAFFCGIIKKEIKQCLPKKALYKRCETKNECASGVCLPSPYPKRKYCFHKLIAPYRSDFLFMFNT